MCLSATHFHSRDESLSTDQAKPNRDIVLRQCLYTVTNRTTIRPTVGIVFQVVASLPTILAPQSGKTTGRPNKRSTATEV